MPRATTVKRFPAVQKQMHHAYAHGVFALASRALTIARATSAFHDVTGRLRAGGAAVLLEGGAESERAGSDAAVGDEAGGSDIVAIMGFPFPSRFLETGTVKMAARPFIGPAAQAASDEGKALVEQGAAERWPR